MQYVPPQFKLEAFHCPHCNTFAHMLWGKLYSNLQSSAEAYAYQATCAKCEQPSVWRAADQSIEAAQQMIGFAWESAISKGVMLFPSSSAAPMPNQDLPENCYQDYMEARDITGRSPRAAAALLRLIIQKLCKHFGEPGKDINTDIGSLVQKGLPKQLQEALDVVRVVGNEAVHPGEVNLDDNPEIVSTLFRLVNLIVEKMITEPKQYSDLYQSLPGKKLDGIAQRDKPKQAN